MKRNAASWALPLSAAVFFLKEYNQIRLVSSQ
jgi:hypothetical protein